MPALAGNLVLNAINIKNLPLAEQGEPMIYVLSFGYCQRIVQQVFFRRRCQKRKRTEKTENT